MGEDGPFSQPKNLAVITLKNILWRHSPVLYVSHDEDDEGWQFLDGSDVREEDARVVALHEMVEIDSSLLALSDLPSGWSARRESAASVWQRFPH